MIPLIQKEAVDRHGWVTDEDILEILAIAESTPGPIAINAATFIGRRVAGFFGALCATLGVVLPSFAVILALAYVLRQFESIAAVKYAFFGIRAGVLALIVKAVVTLGKKAPRGVVPYVILGAAFVAVTFLGAPVLAVIAGSALVGLAASLLAERRGTS